MMINTFNTLQHSPKSRRNCKILKKNVNKHNRKGINYPWGKDDRKIFENNNPMTAIIMLYFKNITHILPKFLNTISKIKWRKIRQKAVSCNKKIICILRGITAKHDGDFYCLDFFHSLEIKHKFESGCKYKPEKLSTT